MMDLKKLKTKTLKYIELLENPFDIFKKADELRRKTVGNVVTYVVNRNINFTNFCICSCKFCSFSRTSKFLLGLKLIKNKVKEAVDLGCTEICIQGGLIKGADINFYTAILEAVREVSEDIHIHAFSPMEIYHMSLNSNLEIEETLKILKERGLNSIPGTSAEILNDSVRKIICPKKLVSKKWIEIIIKAHKLGIPTTATMMYGHIESWEDRILHLLIIKEIQKKTGRFTEFIPLPFLHRNNMLGKIVRWPSGFDDLLVIAISRLILHPEIKNIQASWVKLGIKLAQASLYVGANDLGGTLFEENISKSAGAMGPEFLEPKEMREIIKSCKRVPKQRDTLYNILE